MNNTNIKYKKQEEHKKSPEKEIGGPKGLEPTRYGIETPEWEVNGRVSDF